MNNSDTKISGFIKSARIALGKTQEEFAELFGCTKSNVSGWEKGRHEPTYRLLCEISDKSGIPLPHKQTNLSKEIEILSDSPKPVPLISWVQAGNWSEVIDVFNLGNADEWMPCSVPHSPQTFALRVRGESMYNPHGRPSFFDGDLIFVDPNRQPINGSLIIVRLDNENEATFKKLVIEGERKFLRPLNPAWPDQIIEINHNATICGVVIFKGEKL